MEQFDDLGPVGRLILAEHAQRQRDVLVGGQVVKKLEVLEYDADTAAQRGAAFLRERCGIVVEHGNQAPGRLERQEQHA